MMIKSTILKQLDSAINNPDLKFLEFEDDNPYGDFYRRRSYDLTKVSSDEVVSILFDLSLTHWVIERIKHPKTKFRIFFKQRKWVKNNIDVDVIESISKLFNKQEETNNELQTVHKGNGL